MTLKKFSSSIDPSQLIPLAVTFVILLLAMPRQAKFNYDYRKGSAWNYETLIADFDFPILKTAEQISEERSKSSSNIIPYYRYSEEIVSRNLKGVETLQLGKYQPLKSAISSALNDIYSKGVVGDQASKSFKASEAISDEVLYIQRDKRAVMYPVSEVYKVTQARDRLLTLVGKENSVANVDSILRISGAYSLIEENLVFDKQTTSLVHSESANYISPTQGYVNAGDLIVSNGEIVTAEIGQMLDSYKVEFQNNMGYSGPTILFWIGNAILSFTLVLLFYLTIYFSNPVILREPNRFIYLILVFLISSFASIIAARTDTKLVFLIPFSLSALYLQAFFKNKVILPICFVALLPLLIFCHDGIVVYVMFVTASLVTLKTFPKLDQGWRQFVNSLIIFLTLLIVYLGFRSVDMINGEVWTTLVYLFLGSMLTALGYPLIFLFEKIFNLISNSRLKELAETSNPLLQEFERRAPGSYQHCSAVMQMVDRVGRAIDANVLLLRAGALYHDLGKMNNPRCFIENESLLNDDGIKYHAGLSPEESAHYIIKHVDDGIEIAKKFKLPDVICDFITTHHGTSTTGYFYTRYVNEGGDPDDKSKFMYHGKKPKTKEQAILMICDSIEAASRTLKEHTPESHSKFVEGIVASKVRDEQFSECEISMSELQKMKEVIKAYLSEVYHERISYPHKKSEN